MYDYGALQWLIFACLVVRYMYFIVDVVLYFNKKYAELTPDRRKYVQKNLIKSIFLALLMVIALFTIVVQIWSSNKWDNWIIHRLAALYVSNDLMGLLYVPNLPQTTIIHHVISCILVVISFGIDFNESDIGQAMFVYTMASAGAYVVNLHLAIRWLFVGKLYKFRIFSGVIYVLCCLISWTWHIWWILTRARLSWAHIGYILMLSMIVRDDIILMKWLTKK